LSAARAVVFAYHDVGVRCLKTLLSAGVEVPLIVTVKDDPGERQWFASVAAAAHEYRLPVVMPESVALPELAERVRRLEPDFVFSFYYRSLLPEPLLASPRRGALNLHGSLLPKYRGRAPVNWAIVNGERETGATLHYMVARADAGDIVDQLAVPILEDDEAREVFAKVTVAAEIVLARSLPKLIAGHAPRRAQRLEAGQYFGRRRPEDGRIDWSLPGASIHNLVRAVAPPFPGAFADIGGRRWWIHRTRIVSRGELPGEPARLTGENGACLLLCSDGTRLRILAAATDEGPIDLELAARELAARPIRLG
jgi:methionyl-tRNA formyltransferase